MAALFIWIGILFALVFLCSFSSMLTFVLKGRGRRAAADVTLILATLLIATALLGGQFSKDYVKSKQPDIVTKDYVKECDLAANGLTESSYLDALHEPLRVLTVGLGGTEFQKTLTAVEKRVQTIAVTCPGNAAVTARLAILCHSRGNNVQTIFAKYDQEHGQPSALIDTLKELYSKPVKSHATNYEQSIESGLSKEWYKQTALIDVYKAVDQDKLKQALTSQTIASELWAGRLCAYYFTLLAMVIVSPLTVLLLKRWSVVSSEALPLATSFRRAYACVLALFVAQLVAGLFAGVLIGINSAISHGKIDNTFFQFCTMVPTAMAGAISVLALFYFYICRAKNLSLMQALTWGSIKLNPISASALCFGGFSCAVTLNLIARLLVKLIPGKGPHVATEVQKTIIDSIFSSNAPMVISMLFVACVLAPLTEELAFRVLLYGWLRSRAGLIPSIIVSSLAFAAWHFDASGFWQYFAIGVVLSAIYERTRSFYIVAGIHGMWNFWVMWTISWLTVH